LYYVWGIKGVEEKKIKEVTKRENEYEEGRISYCVIFYGRGKWTKKKLKKK